MDETDIEAGDDAGADEHDAGDDDAGEELVSAESIYKEGAKLFTTWLKKQERQSLAALEAKMDKLAAKAADKLEGKVSKAAAIAKLRALALTRALERETAYDLNGGKIATVRKALTIKPTQMSKELNNIEYLLTTLEKAQEGSFTKTTWSDTVDSWLGMRDLIKKLDSER